MVMYVEINFRLPCRRAQVAATGQRRRVGAAEHSRGDAVKVPHIFTITFFVYLLRNTDTTGSPSPKLQETALTMMDQVLSASEENRECYLRIAVPASTSVLECITSHAETVQQRTLIFLTHMAQVRTCIRICWLAAHLVTPSSPK